MRDLRFDPFEFDSPDAEESVRIAIGPKRQFADAASFLAACQLTEQQSAAARSVGRAAAVPAARRPQMEAHLKQFAGIEAPPADAPALVLFDEWNVFAVVVDSAGCFILYCWETTA